MTLDIKIFYLNTPMERYEYICIKSDDVPEEIIQQYLLQDKVDSEGYIFIEVQKGIYGLPQAGISVQNLLEKHLNKHGYFQNKAVPGLWTHNSRPISFTLVVDDFGIKYIGKKHALHLLNILKEHYEIAVDWTGNKFIGLTMDWDYPSQKVHILMPGYIEKALTCFGHERPKRKQNSLHKHVAPIYDTWAQYVEPRTPVLSSAKQRRHTSKRSPAPSSIMSVQSTRQSSQLSMPSQRNKQRLRKTRWRKYNKC